MPINGTFALGEPGTRHLDNGQSLSPVQCWSGLVRPGHTFTFQHSNIHAIGRMGRNKDKVQAGNLQGAAEWSACNSSLSSLGS